jgi:uncharacterized protein YkwD
MLRAQAVLSAIFFSVLALALELGAAAQASPPTAVISAGAGTEVGREIDNGISSKQPAPRSISAAGASSGLKYDEDAAAENELLQDSNKSRELAGAPPLRTDETLREAARAHARHMIENEQLSHQFPGELALLERIASVGTSSPSLAKDAGRQQDAPELRLDRAGENVAFSNCAAGVNDVLMRSAPHRENLLDRGFNVAGIAAIWSKGRLYVVQDFGHEVPSYSAEQSRKLVSQAIAETRQQWELPALAQLTPPHLDQAACSLASQNRPNARLLATADQNRKNDNRKVIAYTGSRPEVLPQGALRMLRDPSVRQFAVGSCYARNAAYPTGMYWVAILLY